MQSVILPTDVWSIILCELQHLIKMNYRSVVTLSTVSKEWNQMVKKINCLVIPDTELLTDKVLSTFINVKEIRFGRNQPYIKLKILIEKFPNLQVLELMWRGSFDTYGFKKFVQLKKLVVHNAIRATWFADLPLSLESLHVDGVGADSSYFSLVKYLSKLVFVNFESDDWWYAGSIKNGMAYGKGSFFNYGHFYEGYFIDNKANGNGRSSKITNNCLSVYEGNFLNGKPNGKGRCYIEGKCFYEGNFVDDYFCGKGRLFKTDGSFYEGEFVDSKFCGKGCRFCSKGYGIFYEGDFSDNKYHGTGRLFNSEGMFYEGEFIKGVHAFEK